MTTKTMISKRLYSSMKLEVERAEAAAVSAAEKAKSKRATFEGFEVEPDGRKKKVVATGAADANAASGTGSVEA